MADLMSDEVPDLMQTHFEHLTGSAISVEVIRERGYISVFGKAPLEAAGFSKNQRQAPGILIPLYGPDGSRAGHQYRPDNPRKDKKNKLIKYENLPNTPIHLDMSPRCKKNISNPAIPLWITEGAKKIDALASAGACAISLNGVWGFKGKNEFGSTTVLADFDYIALEDRLVYLAFDADSRENKLVRQALERLTSHIKRKGSNIKIINLPLNGDNRKLGVDDYLAQGNSLADLLALSVDELPEFDEEAMAFHSPLFCIHEGQFCVIKTVSGFGKVKSPLCNFIAQVKEEVIHDSGIDEVRYFVIGGTLSNGRELPDIEVPVDKYPALDWILKQWGGKALVCPGSSSKDNLRYMIQRSINGAAPRREYEHTGWREVEGGRAFLSGSGAVGREGIQVSLPSSLASYRLPLDLDSVGADEAMAASVAFMDIGNPDVMLPLWSEMYLAPLAELLNPAFTLWLQGGSGSFKSTLSALALCHFGDFTYLNLPASWRDTDNFLLRLLSILKDIPLVVDDWHPASTVAEQRVLEKKVGVLIRGQGNKAGRGRLKSDTSFQEAPPPRSLIISSGEQSPDGESNAARLFVLDVSRGDIKTPELTEAQEKFSPLYKYAMAHYIAWLGENWADISVSALKAWAHYRNLAQSEGLHLRLPMAVALLYTAHDLAMKYAVECKAITKSKADEYRGANWGILIRLAKKQGIMVDRERAGARFINSFRMLIEQQRVLIIDREKLGPDGPRPGQPFVGWEDEEFWYLLPAAIFHAIYEVLNKGGEVFTFKPEAVWRDLNASGFLVAEDKRNQTTVRVGIAPTSKIHRVVKIKKELIEINQKEKMKV